jgi:hypothetical protein
MRWQIKSTNDHRHPLFPVTVNAITNTMPPKKLTETEREKQGQDTTLKKVDEEITKWVAIEKDKKLDLGFPTTVVTDCRDVPVLMYQEMRRMPTIVPMFNEMEDGNEETPGRENPLIQKINRIQKTKDIPSRITCTLFILRQITQSQIHRHRTRTQTASCGRFGKRGDCRAIPGPSETIQAAHDELLRIWMIMPKYTGTGGRICIVAVDEGSKIFNMFTHWRISLTSWLIGITSCRISPNDKVSGLLQYYTLSPLSLNPQKDI